MFFLSLLLSSLAQAQFNEGSWTCGVFIAGDPNEMPLAKFYEIPSQKASCPAKFRDTWRKGKFSKKCGKMGKEWEKKWIQEGNWELLWSPLVKTLSGGEFGRNVCTVAKEELGLKTVPGLEYPQPFKLGFYYSYCGKEDWKDTGVRTQEDICCKNGASISCEALLSELEGLEKSQDEKKFSISNDAGNSNSKAKAAKKVQIKDSFLSSPTDTSSKASSSKSLSAEMKERIENIEKSLMRNKKLSPQKISETRKAIMGFRSAARLLLKQAQDLQKLL